MQEPLLDDERRAASKGVTPMSDITRRSMLLGSLGAAAISVLSACGGNDSPSPSTSSTSGKSSSAAGAAGSILVWTDSNREPVLRKVAEQFKSDTGVTVKLAVKDFAQIPDDFITQVPTGKGPDATIAAHDATGRMVQNGVVAPPWSSVIPPLTKTLPSRVSPSTARSTVSRTPLKTLPWFAIPHSPRTLRRPSTR